MPDNYTIRIGSQADASGFNEAHRQLDALTSDADAFVAAIGAGVGIDLGGKLVGSLSAIPSLIESATLRGVGFNSVLEGTQTAVAAVLEKFQGLSRDEAVTQAGDALELLKQKAVAAPGTIQQLSESWIASAGAASAANIPINDQIDLMVRLSQAVSRLNLPQQQLVQETRALLTGNINLDAQLAKTLEVTGEQVRAHKEQGDLYGFLVEKIGALGEASDTYEVRLSNLQDTLDQVLGEATVEIFDALREAALELGEALADPATKDSLHTLGEGIAVLVSAGASLADVALKNVAGLAAVTTVAGGLAAVFAVMKLGSIVRGLGLMAAGYGKSAAAITAETAAVRANTAAKEANFNAFRKGGSTVGQLGNTSVGDARLQPGAPKGAARLAKGFGALGAIASAATTGYFIGGAIDEGLGLSKRAGERAERQQEKDAKALESAGKRVDKLVEEARAADDVTKKQAAREAIEKRLADLAGKRGADVELETAGLETVLRRFDKIAGRKLEISAEAKRAAEEKAAAEAAAAQASQIQARAADEALIRDSAGYRLQQAIAGGKTEEIAKIKEEIELAKIREDLRNQGVESEQALNQLAGEQLRTQRAIAARESEAKAAGLREKFEASGESDFDRLGRLGNQIIPRAEDDLRTALKGTDPEAKYEAGIKLKELRKEEADLQAKLVEGAKAQAKTDSAARDARLEAKTAREEELAIARAEVTGDETKVQALEKQRDIRRETAEILRREYDLEKLTGAERAAAERQAAADATASVTARSAADAAGDKAGAKDSAAFATDASSIETGRGRGGRHFGLRGEDITDDVRDFTRAGRLSGDATFAGLDPALRQNRLGDLLTPDRTGSGGGSTASKGGGSNALDGAADKLSAGGDQIAAVAGKLEAAAGKIGAGSDKLQSAVDTLSARIEALERT